MYPVGLRFICLNLDDLEFVGFVMYTSFETEYVCIIVIH